MPFKWISWTGCIYDYTSRGYGIIPSQSVSNKGSIVKRHTNSKLVCKFVKFLYSLKQTPRKWFAKLSEAVIAYGFKQSKVDYSLFTKHTSSSFSAVLIYVDDMVLTGNCKSELHHIKHFLHPQFHMKDLKSKIFSRSWNWYISLGYVYLSKEIYFRCC